MESGRQQQCDTTGRTMHRAESDGQGGSSSEQRSGKAADKLFESQYIGAATLDARTLMGQLGDNEW
jgi:hypothetical protein